LNNGTQAAQNEVRAIQIVDQTELAPQVANPQHGVRWLGVNEIEDKLSRHQDEDEEALHSLQGLNPPYT
jgi:hypothetical protein